MTASQLYEDRAPTLSTPKIGFLSILHRFCIQCAATISPVRCTRVVDAGESSSWRRNAPSPWTSYEPKSDHTIAGDFFAGLESFMAMAAASHPPRQPKSFLVYGGTETQKRSLAEVVSWSDLDRCRWWETEGS